MGPIFVGYDGQQPQSYQVCVRSLLKQSSKKLSICPLLDAHLRAYDLYKRQHEKRGDQLYDCISNSAMSTEFAVSRFIVPFLCSPFDKWALYCDCDFYWRADVADLFALADPNYAVMVVRHNQGDGDSVKMDNKVQTWYPRKNWSSLVLWNLDHKANRRLTLDDVNARRGLELHQFFWLEDSQIGSLSLEWNWLEGISDPTIVPKAVHYTRGVPTLAWYEKARYADEWNNTLHGL